jgi:hypothetical protein
MLGTAKIMEIFKRPHRLHYKNSRAGPKKIGSRAQNFAVPCRKKL